MDEAKKTLLFLKKSGLKLTLKELQSIEVKLTPINVVEDGREITAYFELKIIPSTESLSKKLAEYQAERPELFLWAE